MALARVHSRLVPLLHEPQGYAPDAATVRGWFELPVSRGFAGYGLARALRMLLDVLAGLTALHDTHDAKGQPFVHGEVVPALLRVDRQGVARLVPLAPWHWSEGATLAAKERWAHLSPERLLGDSIDQRADVFSAGVLLWEALAGRRLFENEPVDSIITRLMGDKVILPQLPPELAWAVPLKAVAMRALSVDPEQRFGNCSDLVEAIEGVAAERIASHAEVADYFGAPTPSIRPSLIEPPAGPLGHNSSLSALVSPVRPSEVSSAPPLNENSALRAATAPLKHRAGRRVWAVAALASLLIALGVSALTLHDATRRSEPAHGGAAAAGPLLAAPAVPTPPSADSSASAAPSAVAPAVEDAPSKPSRSPNSAKGLKAAPGPRLKPPAKPAHTRDKEADQYGI